MPRHDPAAARHHARDGEAELIAQHLQLAYGIADAFFFAGAGRDDVRQEALVGLLVAVRDYDGSSPFPAYASHVVRRWLITRVIDARRMKHRPLTDAARVTADEDGDRVAVVELLPGGRDPLEILIGRGELTAIIERLPTLSKVERAAMKLVVNGEPYAHLKRLDNAVQRGRAKLRAAA